jgi:hypothetical protein
MNYKRNRPQDKFITISNEVGNTKEISLKSKGLFIFMWTKPNTWNFTIRSMSKQLPDGVASITSAMNELKDHGFMTYTKNADGSGIYELNDRPSEIDEKKPNAEKPNMGFPNMGKPERISKDLLSNKKELIVVNISIDFDALIKYYNSVTGKQTRKIDAKVKKKFDALIKEGYSKVDIKKAIYNGSKDEFHVGNNYKYFNLELVSRDLTHFERFLNMIPKKTDDEIKKEGGHVNY